tara:strand:- start:12558 stop:14282 length:1725 start_codon:yes stop_codon:yes gene_type:complete
MLDILFKINSLITDRQRRGIIILVILLFIGMILEVFGLGIIIPMINILIDPEMVENNYALRTLKDFFPNFSHRDFVFFFLGVILFLYIIKTLYQVFLTYRQNTFLNNVVATISNNLFASYLKRPYNFHLNSNASGLIKNLQVEVNYFFAFLSSLISLVLELGFLFAIIMTLIFIEPIGAISIGIFYGFLSVLFFQFTKKKLSKWGELREKFDVKVSKTLFEGLGGIKDLLILGKTHIYIEQYSKNNNLKQMLNARMGTLSQIPRFYLELVSILGLLSFISILLYQGREAESLITILGVFVAAIFKMIPSVNKIIAVSQLLKFHYPSVNIIYNELKDAEDYNDSSTSKPNFKFQKSIQFSNVDFGYNTKNITLKGVNLNINSGQTIGIIGESGSGKSTFVDLLVGLHKPISGKILIDGVDGLQMTQSWRNKIGYVSQTIYLTDDSILNNIALGVPDNMIDLSLIKELLNQVQLEKFINSLEKGINTRVGERGVQLSGGQKQRIGLARALYNKPEVLILDEATSALDNLTEKAVMDSVKNLKEDITKIIIAHRLSTLNDCDIIYELLNKQLKKIDS